MSDASEHDTLGHWHEIQAAGERFKEMIWEYLDNVEGRISEARDADVRDCMNSVLDAIDHALPEGTSNG